MGVGPVDVGVTGVDGDGVTHPSTRMAMKMVASGVICMTSALGLECLDMVAGSYKSIEVSGEAQAGISIYGNRGYKSADGGGIAAIELLARGGSRLQYGIGDAAVFFPSSKTSISTEWSSSPYFEHDVSINSRECAGEVSVDIEASISDIAYSHRRDGR